MAKQLRARNGAQPKKDSGKPVQKSTQLEIYVPFIVSEGNGGRSVLHPEWVDLITKAIHEACPEARVTSTGGYYLIDGKVCRVPDFDPETMDRKPGTQPPSWSLTGDEKKAAILAERQAEQHATPAKNQLGSQPANLLTSAETEEVVQSRKKLRPRRQSVSPAVPTGKKLRRNG